MNYFIESSAKTGFNADKIFVQAAKLLYTEFKEIAKTQQENKVINKKLENINNINNIVKKKKKMLLIYMINIFCRFIIHLFNYNKKH